ALSLCSCLRTSGLLAPSLSASIVEPPAPGRLPGWKPLDRYQHVPSSIATDAISVRRALVPASRCAAGGFRGVSGGGGGVGGWGGSSGLSRARPARASSSAL